VKSKFSSISDGRKRLLSTLREGLPEDRLAGSELVLDVEPPEQVA
jgi:hypothetical protein